MSIRLYQFPISHYCEKARWVLDYKGLSYQTVNLLPGLHLKVIRKMAPKSSVPTLDDGGVIVQGSSEIISHLDKKIPDKRLTPINPSEAQQAMEWEQYLDKEIGVHLRRYLYHTLLNHPNIVVPMLTKGAPWWSKIMFRLMFSKVEKLMRKVMKIDAAGAAESKQRVVAALERVAERTADRRFLVGESFSRADLTAAALLAPMFMPPQYGLDWPTALPEPLASDVTRYSAQLAWAKNIYQTYR